MRVSRGILSLTVALAVAPVGIGFAHGGGSMGGGGVTGSAAGSRSSSPENAAKAAYNSGVRSIKEAKEYESDGAKASNPQKSAKALDKAHQYYSKALEQFIDAVSQQPKMYEAWNYIGFANRIWVTMTPRYRHTPRRSSSIPPIRKPSSTAEKPISV